jgi:hypothetical protein
MIETGLSKYNDDFSKSKSIFMRHSFVDLDAALFRLEHDLRANYSKIYKEDSCVSMVSRDLLNLFLRLSKSHIIENANS